MINKKVISDVRKKLDLTHDENIYFDLEHIKGRTYEAGIRLDIKTGHIIYNKVYAPHDYWCSFDTLKGFPKIVFSKNILNSDEIKILDNDKNKLCDIYKNIQQKKDDILEHERKLIKFEDNSQYKVRMNNDLYTVIRESEEGKNETILEKCYIYDLNIEKLDYEIKKKIKEDKDKKLINSILENPECKSFIQELHYYKGLNCYVDLKYDKSAYVILHIGSASDYYTMNNICVDEFIEIVSECKNKLDKIFKRYDIINKYVNKINSCKNAFWSAKISLNSCNITITIDQKIYNDILTYERYTFSEREDCVGIKNQITNMMHKVMRNMEYYNCRVMEVRNEK